MNASMVPANPPAPDRFCFWLVYEVKPGIWDSLPYWNSEHANKVTARFKSAGRLAFVEAR